MRCIRAVLLTVCMMLFIAALFLAVSDFDHKAPDVVYASGYHNSDLSRSGIMAVCSGMKELALFDRAVRTKRGDTLGGEVLVGAEYVNRQESDRNLFRHEAAKAAGELGELARQTVADHRMSYDEYYTLLEIVEAEATGGDLESKLAIANVVLNRVKDSRFPDTVSEVVWQNENGCAQFSPTVDGRLGSCVISSTTEEAVRRAIEGEDNSQGALFFAARDSAEKYNMDWFDDTLVCLFECGGHEFFTFADANGA